MVNGIKVFECAICKGLHQKNIKGEKRFIGTRKDVRLHLIKVHHVNRKAGSPEHKGNRVRNDKGNIKDERSRVTQNCILYKEF